MTEPLATAQDLAAEVVPAQVAVAARMVLESLRQRHRRLGGRTTRHCRRLPRSSQESSTELNKVLTAAGEAVYESVVAGLRKFASESAPQDWESCLAGECGVGFARRDNIDIAAAISLMARSGGHAAVAAARN